jgi:hypothetical protein
MNRERLEHLKVVLSNVKPEKFDMSVWFTEHGTCGTAACAFGYAAMDPKFNVEGLTAAEGWWGKIEPTYAGQGGFVAAMSFFDLNSEQATWLFSDGTYDAPRNERITPQMVIDRIDTLLRRAE